MFAWRSLDPKLTAQLLLRLAARFQANRQTTPQMHGAKSVLLRSWMPPLSANTDTRRKPSLPDRR
jgi:hypothetical protein